MTPAREMKIKVFEREGKKFVKVRAENHAEQNAESVLLRVDKGRSVRQLIEPYYQRWWMFGKLR